MRPELAPEQLAETKPWEYAVRFGFGGVVTVATGLIAKQWGPAVGGLFLAFPAILPASLTLVKQHDGRKKAVEDARGARVGSVGLLAFAAIVAVLAPSHHPVVVLGVATIAWVAVAIGLWALAIASSDHPRRPAARGPQSRAPSSSP
jgi:hypothetical protein